jgi:hypothetical protein
MATLTRAAASTEVHKSLDRLHIMIATAGHEPSRASLVVTPIAEFLIPAIPLKFVLEAYTLSPRQDLELQVLLGEHVTSICLIIQKPAGILIFRNTYLVR